MPKILLVEDEEPVRLMLKEVLEGEAIKYRRRARLGQLA